MSLSTVVVPFKAPPKKGEFERYRETWSRQVLADTELSHRAARVASFLVWYINRTSRTAFPSRSEIAKGTGIDRDNVRKDINKLVARGHLQIRRPEKRGQRNNYLPVLWDGGGVTITPGGVTITPEVGLREPAFSNNSKSMEGLTSDLTSDITSDSKRAAYKQEAYKHKQEAYESNFKGNPRQEGEEGKQVKQSVSPSDSNSCAESLPPLVPRAPHSEREEDLATLKRYRRTANGGGL
jgi:DNA replication protein DnaD